jgi:hypothetical protein
MTEVRTKFEKILEEHRQLRCTIDELREFLQAPRPEIGHKGYHTWASSLAEKLTGLHSMVYRHFREEERSGFLEELLEVHPQAERTVDVLRRDHDRILADFRAVLGATLVYAEGKAPERPQLRQWTLAVLDQLSQHESDETELVQKLTYHDLGSVD